MKNVRNCLLQFNQLMNDAGRDEPQYEAKVPRGEYQAIHSLLYDRIKLRFFAWKSKVGRRSNKDRKISSLFDPRDGSSI
jgi:hypothetical protein